MLVESGLVGFGLVVAGGKVSGLGVWKDVCDFSRDSFRMEVVTGTVEDENGCGDGFQLGEGGEGAVVPHAGEDGVVRPLVDGSDGVCHGGIGGEEGLEPCKGFEVGLGHLAGVGDEFEMSGLRGVEPRGAEEDEFFESVRVAEGDVEGDTGAHGEATEVAFFEAEMVHEGDGVIREGVEGIGSGIEGHGVSVSGQVGGDEVEVGEVVEGRSGLGTAGSQSVEEDEWFAVRGADGFEGKHLKEWVTWTLGWCFVNGAKPMRTLERGTSSMMRYCYARCGHFRGMTFMRSRVDQEWTKTASPFSGAGIHPDMKKRLVLTLLARRLMASLSPFLRIPIQSRTSAFLSRTLSSDLPDGFQEA